MKVYSELPEHEEVVFTFGGPDCTASAVKNKNALQEEASQYIHLKQDHHGVPCLRLVRKCSGILHFRTS